MPENIFNRRPKLFRHFDDLHLLSSEIEQGQILFEHEEHELLVIRVREKCTQEGEQVLGNACAPALNNGSGNTDSHSFSFRLCGGSGSRSITHVESVSKKPVDP